MDVVSLGQRKSVNGSAPSSDICRLKGSRFVVASEPKSDFVFDEGRIKSFTGNDTINARMLYQNNIEFKPTFKIFIGTNNRPNVNDDSILESFRLRVVPFTRHFTAAEQNRNLKEQLKEQSALDALFMKCIEGFNEFMQIGLAEPKEVLEATAGYQTQGQVFQIFLDNQMVVDATATTPLSVFYPIYQSWCTENGFTPLNKTNMKRIMEQKGIFKATATIGGKTIRNILNGYKLQSSTPPTIATVTSATVTSITTKEMDSTPLPTYPEEDDYPF
jgi:putative DNA primase/helicase